MQLLNGVDSRLIYLAAVASALAITAWTAFTVEVPNPDALVYLRAAEHFANGEAGAALSVYRWPFYSAVIAVIHLATGWPMMAAAHVADALFFSITVVAFIALAERLLGGRTTVVAIAALVIVLHPKLMEMRGSLIRDHGFHAFYLCALYFTVRDVQTPRLWAKLLILASIGLATLFRPEALVLAVLIPFFHLFIHGRSMRGRIVTGAVLAGIYVLALPGYILWTGVIHRLIAGEAIDIAEIVSWHMGTISARIAWLREVIPAGRNTGEFAYIGAALLIFGENVLRAITYPLALLAVFAFWPRRLMSPFASRFTAWFVLWQMPMLLVFTVFQLYLDWRYAMGLAFVAAIPAIAVIDMLVREFRLGFRRARIALPLLASIVVVSAVGNIPQNRHPRLKQAGEWVAENVPHGALIATNEARIALFSGRPYPEEVEIYARATTIDWPNVGYIVVDIGRSNTPPADPVFAQLPMIARIDGDRGDGSVLVYKVR